MGSIDDYIRRTQFLYVKPDLTSSAAVNYLLQVKDSNTISNIKTVIGYAKANIPSGLSNDIKKAHDFCNAIVEAHPELSKPQVFQALRYALTGSVPGIDIPTIFMLLGTEASEARLAAGSATL